MQLRVEAISHQGMVRKNNEDHILTGSEVITSGERFFDYSPKGNTVFAVADGMGGHKAGEVASEWVLTNLYSFVAKMDNYPDAKSFKASFSVWIDFINAKLLEAGRKDNNLKGMGTTLTGMFINHHGFYVFNTGDSRAYIFKEGTLARITKDHTLAEATGIKGMRTNMLVNCIGATGSSFADITDVTHLAAKGVVFLFCTDGLTDMLQEEQISDHLYPLQIKKMVEHANRAGGRDNISVLALKITG